MIVETRTTFTAADLASVSIARKTGSARTSRRWSRWTTTRTGASGAASGSSPTAFTGARTAASSRTAWRRLHAWCGPVTKT